MPRLLQRQKPLTLAPPDVLVDGLVHDGADPLPQHRAASRARLERERAEEKRHLEQQGVARIVTEAQVHERRMAAGRAGRVVMERIRREGR